MQRGIDFLRSWPMGLNHILMIRVLQRVLLSSRTFIDQCMLNVTILLYISQQKSYSSEREFVKAVISYR